MEKRKLWRVVAAILAALAVVLWTAVIFSQSAKNGAESSSDSDGVRGFMQKIVDLFLPGVVLSSHFIRKAAHFCEYGVLGALCGLAAVLGRRHGAPLGRIRYGVAWLYTVAVALCDEFVVQRLTEGRGPGWGDVLIDSAGGVAGIGFVLGLWWFLHKNRMMKKER